MKSSSRPRGTSPLSINVTTTTPNNYTTSGGNYQYNQNCHQQQQQQKPHPLKQQTIHVINSLRETLNRIDEGLPTSAAVLNANGHQHGSNKYNNLFHDDLVLTTAAPNKFVHTKRKSALENSIIFFQLRKPLYKTTLLMTAADSPQGKPPLQPQTAATHCSNGFTGKQQQSHCKTTPDNGHSKLSSLEKNLKTVSFGQQQQQQRQKQKQQLQSCNSTDSASEASVYSSPDRTSATGLYDNVESYSPGPSYEPLASCQRQESNSNNNKVSFLHLIITRVLVLLLYQWAHSRYISLSLYSLLQLIEAYNEKFISLSHYASIVYTIKCHRYSWDQDKIDTNNRERKKEKARRR